MYAGFALSVAIVAKCDKLKFLALILVIWPKFWRQKKYNNRMYVYQEIPKSGLPGVTFLSYNIPINKKMCHQLSDYQV